MTSGQNLTIQLPQFEGPLGLLLYLIRKEEMDILNISIHTITDQYLEQMKLMKELDLEVAGEFVAMAATLIHIKSRMLLPQYDENGEIVENEDPRRELVQRLLEYQKYQEAARLLYERPLMGRDFWPRGYREKLEAVEEEIQLEENALFSLITAYRRALKTAKKKIHQVVGKLQSIAQRILQMKELLVIGHRIAMSQLVAPIFGTQRDDRRRQILITFLSLLELGKMGIVSLFQTDVYQEIYVETKKSIEADMMSRVEEYDNLNAADAAASMIQKSEQAILASESDEGDFVDLADSKVTMSANPDQVSQEQTLISESFADTEFDLSSSIESATDDEILLAEMDLEHSELNSSDEPLLNQDREENKDKDQELS